MANDRNNLADPAPGELTYFDYFAAIGKDLKSVFARILCHRTVFSIVFFLCLLAGLGYALFSQPTFRAQTLLVPRAPTGTGGLSQLLGGGGLSSVSSLIGLPGDKAGEELMAALKARSLIYPFIEQAGIKRTMFPMLWDQQTGQWRAVYPGRAARIVHLVKGTPLPPIHYGPTLEEAYSAFVSKMLVSEDPKSGIIQLSIDWHDPTMAAAWVNGLVKMLNDERRQEAITSSRARIQSLQTQLGTAAAVEIRGVLVNLIQSETEQIVAAQSEQQFAFRVIDPAVPPENRTVSRGLILFLSGLIGVFIASGVALIWASVAFQFNRLSGRLFGARPRRAFVRQ